MLGSCALVTRSRDGVISCDDGRARARVRVRVRVMVMVGRSAVGERKSLNI